MQLVAAVALIVVLRADPDAQPAAHPTPEAEIEELLAASAPKSPPAEVVVMVDGPDPKVYRLEQATVHLDGLPVAASVAHSSGPPPKGTPVSDGDHVLSARLVYRGQAFGPYPWQEGPSWALPARVTLQAARGLRLIVRLTVETNEHAPLVSQRLTLRSEVEPEMVVAVDDAPLPPPPPPQLPASSALSPVASASEGAPATAAPPPTPPGRKKKKKAARAARPSATVPASAVASPAAPAAAADALEEATARLRSALAAPGDGGVASGTSP